jgi:uncharacterized protein YjbI with pentapeptide repeats
MTYLEMHWQTIVILAAAVLTMVIVLCGVGWLLWWRLPRRYVDRLRLTIRDAKARADIEDNIRKTIGQLLAVVGTLLGAAVVLIGAGSAYLQFTEQQRNSQQQFRAQQETSQQQFEHQQKASRDLLISNQVAKGFELLGNKDNPIQRLGGIYALEGVMNTSKEYHQPVLEALCAFVRDNTKNVTGNGTVATDVRAALTVIGRRDTSLGKAVPDLQKVRFPNADLRGVRLAGADLFEADLSRAILSGADLSGADLGGANLSRADLTFATLSRANLRHVDLSGADLSEAELPNADLSGAVLNGAKLNDANLGSAVLSGANLIRADLSDAFLKVANLGGANLSGAKLRGAFLTDAYLHDVIGFTPAQLDAACGDNVPGLDPSLTLKSCK